MTSKQMTSRQIRQQFLDYFAARGHAIVDSSPVVPHDDPTLMFTNAGMNQFKDVFLGTGSRPYKRAADTQKCIRAGGKHNDLDDVGQDTYHHTFFEMLGNWSFGDYFKKEAIRWAWELLTKVWGIDKRRLHATYFEGDAAEGLEPDAEAAELWRTETDIDPSHIHPGNKKDNFWEMGDTGPCGPCSEIHIDLTPDLSGGKLVNAGDARVIEIWNLVFIQFNRAADGRLSPLPAKHVDTGMGFERLCAVLQGMAAGKLGRFSNYDTDVFTPIFAAIQRRTGAPAYQGTLPGERHEGEGGIRHGGTEARRHEGEDAQSKRPAAIDNQQLMVDVSYRVIADHIRCLTFAITDGALPSNEGRGYVLRRILRRAVRYGRQYLDMQEPFLCDLVSKVVEHMAEAFPELRTGPDPNRPRHNVPHIAEIIRDEEHAFFKTLDRAIGHFESAVAEAIGRAVETDRGWTFIGSGETHEMPLYGSRTRKGFHLLFAKVKRTDCDLADVYKGAYAEETISLPAISREEIRKLTQRIPAISGEHCFKLHDTYGFSIDLTQLMATELGVSLDLREYERLMHIGRQRARGALRGTGNAGAFWHELASLAPAQRFGRTEFLGYQTAQTSARVLGIVKGPYVAKITIRMSEGEQGVVILDKTPFYSEKGGQVADTGHLTSSTAYFVVEDVQEVDGVVMHIGRCTSGMLTDFQPALGVLASRFWEITAEVDNARRIPTMRHHTATHVLNWALREVLCTPEEREQPHVQQKGSLVDPEKTRFDFSHHKPLTDEEIERIEKLCQAQIAAGLPVYAATREEDFVDQKQAREISTLRAVFGEKYPDKVRVVSIGVPITEEDARRAREIARAEDGGSEGAPPEGEYLLSDPKNPKWMQYSVEFCGGTHVANTVEIGDFVLTHEEGVAKGVRRVVGVAGEVAKRAIELGRSLLAEVEGLDPSRAREEAGRQARGGGPGPEHQNVGMGEDLSGLLAGFQQRLADAVIPIGVRRQIAARVAELQKLAKEQEKETAAASGAAVMDAVGGLLEKAEVVGGVTVVVGEVPPADADALRGAIDWIRSKTPASAVLLAFAAEGKVTMVAGMSKEAVTRGLKAGDLIKEIAPKVGGRGGGRPDMAQGGGTDPAGLGAALEAASTWVRGKL